MLARQVFEFDQNLLTLQLKDSPLLFIYHCGRNLVLHLRGLLGQASVASVVCIDLGRKQGNNSWWLSSYMGKESVFSLLRNELHFLFFLLLLKRLTIFRQLGICVEVIVLKARQIN